jgi:hypothetical protein
MNARRAALWAVKHWYIVLIAVLALRLWAAEHRPPAVAGPSLERVGRDTLLVRTEPIVVREPMAVESLFKTSAWKEYQEEIKGHVSAEVGRILEDRGESPAAVTEAKLTLPGGSETLRVGEAVDRPYYRLDWPAPEQLRLTIKPRRLRVGIVETREGPSYAEVNDMATGERYRIDELAIRRVAPRWQRRWLQVGFAAGYSATADAQGINISASVTALALHKGTRTVQFGRFEADRHRVNVDVLRVTL